MKKLISTIITLVLLSSIFLIAVPINASEPIYPDYEPVDWQSGLAGQVQMPTMDASGGEMSVGPDLSTPPVGTWVYDWYIGAISGNPALQLRKVLGNVEVWVANEDALKFPAGDPRNDDPKNWNVTEEMVDYIAEEFNSVIYPTDVTYFGAPLDRDGTGTIFQLLGWPSYTYDWIETDNPQRVIIKIFNIQDDNYFDPTYPYYVVGFYSSTYTVTYYNRNMIHIDNWRYWQRLGPEGTQWYPDTYPELTVTRPYVYDATFAHEFQHNIHRDWQPAAETFMNEGCSMYAELVCGYGIEVGYFNSYFATPDNSLTVWGDQGDINILADYGLSALWTIYLSDHYGGADTIRYYVQSGIPGIEGIENALDYYGYVESFFDVYYDFRLANLLREETGPYGYTSIDLNDPEIIPVRIYHSPGLQWTQGTDFGNTITILGYDTGVDKVGPFGTDYVKMDSGFGTPRKLNFDGDDTILCGWTMTPYGWYSGAENLMDTLLYGEAYVDPMDPTLWITTYWDMEDYWDFGFVQVSTDSGFTWTSLENDYTTYDHDPSAHPDIIANLPGLTSWSGFIDPDGWITMSFDLTAYAGANVLIGFRYMTDWNTLYEGWYISEATVGGVPVELTPVYPEADFQVTVIEFYADGTHTITHMILDDATETGKTVIDTQKPDYTILVVSATMLRGFADYLFKASPLSAKLMRLLESA
jgi:immune inhibitor A